MERLDGCISRTAHQRFWGTIPISIALMQATLVGGEEGRPRQIDCRRQSSPTWTRDIARAGYALDAAGGVLAVGTGLIAQHRFDAELPQTTEAWRLLIGHRLASFAFLGMTGALAVARAWCGRPTAGTLALGAVGIALSVVLGALCGRLVYDHGVGVER